MWFELTAPDGTIVYPIREDGLEGRWAYGKQAVLEMGENLIWKNRGSEGTPVWVPYSREWAPEIPVKPNPTILYDVHTSRQAKAEVKEILGQSSPLETIKPVLLLETILRIATRKGDLVLDSFAGSATTAHAVMKLNAEDEGNRRFILVEMDPTVATTVTVERAKRVARGYTNLDGEAIPGLGSDFCYCRLGSPLFRGNGSLNNDLTPDTLARHLYFTEFGEPLRIPPPPNGGLIGTYGDTALHLLWDADGPGFLDATTLRALPPWEGEHVVYGEGCAVPVSVLQDHRVSFRQIPYRVRG